MKWRARCPGCWLIMFCCGFQMASAAVQESAVPIHVSNREALQRALETAKPGTRVAVHPGTYRGGLRFNRLQGTAEKPIVIAASDPTNPPIIQGGDTSLHLVQPAYIEIHNLIFERSVGNGVNIDDGGSNDSIAHHVVLKGLILRGIGSDGNHDGIKLSGVDNFVIESCTIYRWGANGSAIDMVGCHTGQVIGCSFRHSSANAANGVQTKGGSRDITIKRCRFENAGGRSVNIGGSTGQDYFRPRAAPYEAKDITVEDCTFVGSQAPICFVGVDGAVVRHNTIYRPGRYVIQILQESREAQFVPCRNGQFSHNIIAFRSGEIRGAVNVGPGTAPESFGFTKNHWYCLDRPANSNRLSLPVVESSATYGIDPQFIDADNGDVRLQSTSLVHDAGARTR